MAMLRRFALFFLVNLLVIVTISVILNVLGVGSYLTAYGMNYEALMIFCLVWGMGGAFISLMLSRVMAKWMMGVTIVSPQERDPVLNDLVQMVHGLARAAKLTVMPEVGIYNSPEVNAFATGPSRSRSLVAVSTGLLQRMNRDQLHGVLGHEIAHIANGDMVTMTLIQGVINAFVMFLARAIAFAVAQSGQGSREEGRSSSMNMATYYIVQFVLEIVFMILGHMVVAWFSRLREFRADAGGARYAGKSHMIGALQGLQSSFNLIDANSSPSFQSFKISSKPGGFLRFFSTHPPLEERIARLQRSQI